MNHKPFHQNEIRDFTRRAPPPVKFDGVWIQSFENVRRRWLSEILSGTIDERINRRAGLKIFQALSYAPWRGPYSAIKRRRRRELQIAGMRCVCHAHCAC